MTAAIAPVESLVSAVYVSSAAKPMAEEEILELLRIARAKNERLGITGMLLYREGNFLQVLEGPASAIDQVIDKIKKDPRHKGLILMSRKPVEERLFPEWQMAFRNMNKTPGADQGRSPFLDLGSADEEVGEQSQLVYRLLRRFKQDMR
jgi:hypothetical protein